MLTDVIALFGAGVASFLAPCVVPLVPAYLGMLIGASAEDADPAKAVPATAVFVLGFATLYAALGVAAGSLGSALDSVETWVQRIGGVVIIVMGLALLGLLRGIVGRFMNQERRVVNRLPSGTGPVRSFVMGLAFGAAWSPCVGPLLGAALTVAATRGEPLRGGVLLLAYALGIGVPFLVASLGFASSESLAGWLRRVSGTIERVAGVLLIALGFLLVSDTYRHLTSYLARYTPTLEGL